MRIIDGEPIRSAPALADRFPAILKLGAMRGRRRIPFVQQLSPTECGAACLAMVLGYHGRDVRLEQLREACAVGRNGVSALTLLDAASLFGLRGRGVRVEPEQLRLLHPTSILHWQLSHFVVLDRLTRKGADILDPAVGRRHVPLAELRKSLTGVALVLEPREDFAPEQQRRNLLWPAMRSILRHSGLLPRICVTSLLVQLLVLALPVFTGQLVDRVAPQGHHHLLAVLLMGAGTLVVFSTIAGLIRSHLLPHLRTLLDARMTLGFLDHLVGLPYSYFQHRPAGDLMMRLNSKSLVREMLTSGVLSGLLDGVMVIVYLALLLVLSPTIGGLVLVIGLIKVVVVLSVRRRQHEINTESLQVESRSQSYQIEMLTGMGTLKAMGAEHRAVMHWSDLFIDVLNISLRRGRLMAAVDAALGILRAAAPLSILTAGALLVMNGSVMLGEMLALNALGGSFLVPLSNLVTTGMQLQLLGSYLERINDVLDSPLEQDRAKIRRPHVLCGQIALRRVSFRYGPLAPLVVDDVSLTIEPGQLVAVVGRSGAGKSTLASLLLGLHRPIAGQILYDGVELGELDLQSVRRQMGVVIQHHHLFATTIRDNIALGDPSLSLDQVTQAAKVADIHDEIMAMPLGVSDAAHRSGCLDLRRPAGGHTHNSLLT